MPDIIIHKQNIIIKIACSMRCHAFKNSGNLPIYRQKIVYMGSIINLFIKSIKMGKGQFAAKLFHSRKTCQRQGFCTYYITLTHKPVQYPYVTKEQDYFFCNI